MDRIISIVCAFFAVMFTMATAQAKPGLPSDSEIIRVDCTTGAQCVQLNTGAYQTIEELIARESIQATPELAALTTDTVTGIAFNLSSGAVAVRGYLPSGGFEVIWPPDYGVDKVDQLRKLASARRWTREEFGLSARGRAKGAKFVVAKEIPLAQRLWLAGPKAIADHLEQMNVSPAQSAPGQSPPSDDDPSALQAALSQESSQLTALRHAIADCDGRVQLNESGAPVCVAAAGTDSVSAGEIVFLILAFMGLTTLFFLFWYNKWANDAYGETRESLRLAQAAHSALHTLYLALRVQVDRAKALLNAGDQETVDNAADATRRGVLVALGVDYREVPCDTDIVKAVSGKVAQLKDKYHELAAQIRRARGVLRAAEAVDLAAAAQARMDELAHERTERATLISKVGEALGELDAHEADVGEIALHARAAADKIDSLKNLKAELSSVQEELVRIADAVRRPRDANGALVKTVEEWVARAARAEQALLGIKELQAREISARGMGAQLPENPLEAVIMGHDLLAHEAAQTRADAEVNRQLASRTQAELSGLRGRVTGFAAVTEKIAAALDGAEYVHQHPYARPRWKKGGQITDSPHRQQFGQLVSALRGVFPAPPPEPKPPRPARRRSKLADAAAMPA